MKRLFLLPLLIFTVFSSTAIARVNICPYVTFSTNWYKMADLNEELDDLRFQHFDIKSVKRDLGYSAGFWLAGESPASWGLNFTRLVAETEHNDGRALLSYNVPADAVEGMASIRLFQGKHTELALGFGIGYYWCKGKFKASESREFISGDIYASTVGFRVFFQHQIIIAPGMMTYFSAGYRFAEADEVELDGTRIPDYSLDWTGATVQLGLLFIARPDNEKDTTTK